MPINQAGLAQFHIENEWADEDCQNLWKSVAVL